VIYRSAFSSFTNHLGNAKPKEQPEKHGKENRFVPISKLVFLSF
jgi:hypothetical protein